MVTNVKSMSTDALCQQLNSGWPVVRNDVCEELVSRWARRLGAQLVESIAVESGGYVGEVNCESIRLRGATNCAFVIIPSGLPFAESLHACRRQSGQRLTIVASEYSTEHALREIPGSPQIAYINLHDLRRYLTEPQPLEQFKKLLLQHFKVSRLNPYDTTHPVESNMFFGRKSLLDRIWNEETTSFAIAGPGRIGKSSILHQYARRVRRNQYDDRRERLVFIDCYPLRSLDPDTLAQELAVNFTATATAKRSNQHTFLHVLRDASHERGGPLELLLDEVDSIASNPTFQQIGEAVRSGFCRILVCGKGELYRLVRRHENQFTQRLELLSPEPLDLDSATRLLRDPMDDLGFQLDTSGELINRLMLLTGRRPHLIQASAKRLLDLAIEKETKKISVALLELVLNELVERFYGTLPLEDFPDDLTRLITLLLLRAGGINATTPATHTRDDSRSVTIAYLQELAKSKHVDLSAERALQILETIWIANILTREGTQYFLPNAYLSRFVRKLDFNHEIDRLALKIVSAWNSRYSP